MSRIHEVYAYLRVADAARAIDYYAEAFGAEEKYRLVEPGGRVGHAELSFGGTTIMLSDEFPEMDIRGPASIGGTSVSIHLHVDDADAVLESAAKAGGEIVRLAQDHFYGERSGIVRDPFGHEWNVGHSIEEVSPEEMQRRYDDLMKG
jgi:uncharacterized glyoxalase superfamily protein PhnB